MRLWPDRRYIRPATVGRSISMRGEPWSARARVRLTGGCCPDVRCAGSARCRPSGEIQVGVTPEIPQCTICANGKQQVHTGGLPTLSHRLGCSVQVPGVGQVPLMPLKLANWAVPACSRRASRPAQQADPRFCHRPTGIRSAIRRREGAGVVAQWSNVHSFSSATRPGGHCARSPAG